MRAFLSVIVLSSSLAWVTASCGETDSTPGPAADRDASLDATRDAPLDATADPKDVTVSDSNVGLDAGMDSGKDAPSSDAADARDATDAALPNGLTTPIPYKSRADSPFTALTFPSYFHFEDWEDGLVNTPGVTPSSTQVSAPFGSLVDSIDGDDGVVDGVCAKDGGTCNSGFAGGGTIEFTFDAVALGALPTHVGIAWTDGATACDAVFEAYDSANVLIGTKTAAAVGDNSNSGTVDEDRFFGVVHTAGVKRIVVKSSSGGVEVDHLQYGR